MATTIAGIVQKPLDAQRLIDELVQGCLCDRADISVVARDSTAGAAKSMLDGAWQGFEAFSRSLPGGGMLRFVGGLGRTLADTAVTGAAETAKVLADLGVPKGEARYYGEAFEGGGMLVTVHAKTDNMARCVREAMRRHGALAPGEPVT
jgi:hypothetical protein